MSQTVTYPHVVTNAAPRQTSTPPATHGPDTMTDKNLSINIFNVNVNVSIAGDPAQDKPPDSSHSESSASPAQEPPSKPSKTPKRRTKTGCHTCRRR